MRSWLGYSFIFSALIASGAAKADPWPLIAPITSEVYETKGSAREIAAKGATCMARYLRPGVTAAPTIISTDLEGGRVVANNAYETPGILGQPIPSRSTATLEAKDGRFRLVFADMEEMPTPQLGWLPLRGRRGPDDAGRTFAILKDIGDRVAMCVIRPDDDW
jgi:hypothetical protein